MNLFIYIQLKQINYKFKKTPTIFLYRTLNHELEWYLERI